MARIIPNAENRITQEDHEAHKSNDLLKRNFNAEKPCKKCVTDITEIPAKDGKLYVSAIFDCYDALVPGIAMADNMRAELCVKTVENAYKGYPDMLGAILHSDRGSQYTSEKYRCATTNLGIIQSMNSAALLCSFECCCVIRRICGGIPSAALRECCCKSILNSFRNFEKIVSSDIDKIILGQLTKSLQFTTS